MKHSTWLLALLLLLVPTARTQDTKTADSVVDAIIREGKDNSKVMEHLDHLVNKIGPRLTSSDRLTQACEWAKEQFESFGCKNVRLEEWGEFHVGFNRGPWSGKAKIGDELMQLTCGTMAWTPGTEGPVEGRAVLAPATEEEIDREKLKGAWVIVGAERRQRGIADKLNKIYDEVGIAGLVRSSRGELIVTSGNHRIRWDNLPKRVSVVIVQSQFNKIVEAIKAGKDVRLTFDIKNEFKKGPIKLYNVIADIPGTDKPDEYVIIGGHIDSWDGATGTTDNGTGTATTLEAARLLCKAGARPKRTIRFMLWSGEEQGLLGSRAWIKKNPDQLKKISGVFVHDGGTNYLSGIHATKSMVPLFEKIFKPVASLDEQMKFTIRQVRTLPRGIGSDHDAFLSAGVPGFFWIQSRLKDKGQNYSHEHHTQHDVYSAAIPEFQRHSSIVIAVAAWGVANLDDLLPRTEIRSGGGDQQRGRRLGIQGDDDMVITSVGEDSPAEKAGLQEGDRILKIGKTAVTDLESLRAAVQKAEKQTTVTIKRGGKEMELPVTFDP